MVRRFLSLVPALALAGGCCLTGENDGSIVEGFNPAVSRDGKYLSFSRLQDFRVYLGVVELATGKITWIHHDTSPEARFENACHAAWGPDNALAYSYANLTNTAYQRFYKKECAELGGYRLRLWKDGRSRDLVKGLSRNFCPSFSPDGKRIYFCKHGGKTADFDFKDLVSFASLDLDDPKLEPKLVWRGLPGDAAISQPVVSPNGKLLAYADLFSTYSQWGIRVGRLGNLKEQIALTPAIMSGYAPNWMPDSKHILFTGFFRGDPTWCIYIVDVTTGAMKKLVPGEDAAPTPDGKGFYYSCNGRIYRRDLSPADFPVAQEQWPDPTTRKEEILYTFEGPTTKRWFTTFAKKHACDAATAHFVRYRLDWDGREKGFLFSGGFDGTGMQQGVHKGCLNMCIHQTGMSIQSRASFNEPLAKGRHTVTCIVAKGMAWLSLDGGAPLPRRFDFEGVGCTGKGAINIYPNAIGDKEAPVSHFEIGIGWPANVPKPLMPRDL